MKKKLIIFLCVLGVLGAIFCFDYVRSLQYHIKLVSVSPDPAPADGQSPVSLQVQLTDRKGRPVEGHSLFAYSLGGGNFKANRELTDKEGKVQYIYFPYKTSPLFELKDVSIKVIDESNSVILEINTATVFDVHLKMPEKQEGTSQTLEDIFGE